MPEACPAIFGICARRAAGHRPCFAEVRVLMPRFEIADDAYRIVTGQIQPVAVPDGLPALDSSARLALDGTERYTRPGTLIVMRRLVADREAAHALCEWFVKAESVLRQSADSIDQSRSRICGAAAKAIAHSVPPIRA